MSAREMQFLLKLQKNQILIDGGSSSVILEKLGKEMPFRDRSIDLIILRQRFLLPSQAKKIISENSLAETVLFIFYPFENLNGKVLPKLAIISVVKKEDLLPNFDNKKGMARVIQIVKFGEIRKIWYKGFENWRG